MLLFDPEIIQGAIFVTGVEVSGLGLDRKLSSWESRFRCFSSPDVRGKKMRHELPKSYSQHNSNRDSEERRRTSRKDRKQRHSKRRRRRDVHRSGGSSRNYRHDGSKKHKRKFTPDTSPKKPSSYVNGDDLSPDSPSSKKRHRHRSHKDSNKKRRSHSPNRINKRWSLPCVCLSSVSFAKCAHPLASLTAFIIWCLRKTPSTAFSMFLVVVDLLCSAAWETGGQYLVSGNWY